MNIIDTVGVYGTLKKKEGNYRTMGFAGGEYIGEDYIQIGELGSGGFPFISLSNNSNKWLKVELFNVPIEGIKGRLDTLEGYSPNNVFNLYNRVKIETKNGHSIWVYEYASHINKDVIEDYYTHNKGTDLFYNWTSFTF